MKTPRSFYQAAFQYACEWSGTHPNVAIDGNRAVSVTSVAVRHCPADDELQGDVAWYELTLFDQGGDWRQIKFDSKGQVIDEQMGSSKKPPKISRSKEAL